MFDVLPVGLAVLTVVKCFVYFLKFSIATRKKKTFSGVVLVRSRACIFCLNHIYRRGVDDELSFFLFLGFRRRRRRRSVHCVSVVKDFFSLPLRGCGAKTDSYRQRAFCPPLQAFRTDFIAIFL